MSTNNELLDHPLGPTLKYMAMGMEARAPIIAALFVVFFDQKNSNNVLDGPGHFLQYARSDSLQLDTHLLARMRGAVRRHHLFIIYYVRTTS